MRNEAWIGLLAWLAACQTASMGQFGEEEQIRCEATSRTPKLSEDTVEIGYVDELVSVLVGDELAIAAGTFAETIRWSDDTETAVTAVLADAGSPELVAYEDTPDEHETEPGPCPTKLEFTAQVTLTTADGRLDEAFVGAASTVGDTVYVEHRLTAPGGTIDVDALAQEGVDVEADVVRVNLRVSEDPAAFSGYLLPQPLVGDGDAQPLGTWPADEVDE